jgi:hypothetical protein
VLRLSLLRAALWLGMGATVATSVLMVTAREGLAQQGPIRLFPQPETPSAAAPELTPDRDRTLPPGGPAERAGAPIQPAPPPGATPEFVVEGLAAPEVDAIGLAEPSGGFDRALWQGSDPEVIYALLSDLPVVSEVPPLRGLTRRLLVTGAPVAGGAGRLLGTRLARLIAMGDLDAAKALVDQLPPAAADSGLARSAAEVALLSGDQEAACRIADAVGLTTGAEFWAKVAVYCRLAAGDAAGARLGLDLLREARQTADAAFFELATAIADETGPPPLESLGQPSAIHVALLALAEWPLPPAALAGASPPILAAVARAPARAGAERLPATEQAFLVGAASAEQVAALYAELADVDDSDVMWQIQSNWGVSARAMAYNAVQEQSDPLARAEVLDAAWRAAGGAERFLVAEVFAAPFTELPTDRGLVGMAPSVARALLGADLLVPAGRWLSLLTTEAREDAQRRSAVANLAPLFALAGIGGSDAVPRLDPAAVGAWVPAATDGEVPTERLFALLEGVGAPIEAEAWERLLPAHAGRQEPAPASALWRGLERAAADRRVGESVLYALTMLNGRPQAVHPEALVACLRALRRVGLDRDARAIAVATALIDGN